MKKIIALIITLLFVFNTVAFAEVTVDWASENDFNYLYPYFRCGMTEVTTKEGLNAVINKYGQIVIDYTDKELGIAPNGLIAVLGDNDKIGFFNAEGQQVTDYIYDSYIDVNPKSKNTKIGYITNISNPYYAGDDSSDIIPVSLDKKFGFINYQGTVVLPFVYEYAYGFFGGIAMICSEGILSNYGTYTNGKYGFIRTDGSVILPANSYWSASRFDSEWGYAYASNGAADSVLIDRYGNVFKRNEYGYAPIDTDYIQISSYDASTDTTFYGVVDRYNNIIVPMWSVVPIEVVNGNAFLVGEALWNNKGEVLYEAKEGEALYTQVNNAKIVHIKVPDPDNQWHSFSGCMTTDGTVILPPVYEYITDLGEGLIHARTSDKSFLFDSAGKLLCKLNGQPQGMSSDGFFIMQDFDTMNYKIALNPIVRPKININGEKTEFTDAFPYIENGRTMVPLRAVFEDMGAVVEWDDETQTVTVSKSGLSASMTIGSNVLNANGNEVTVDAVPVLKENRTYIPLRALSEGVGIKVDWDSENYIVELNI